jgi:hypothetical protein
MTIWLYHINPKNRHGYKHGWDISRPSTLLYSREREWPAGIMFKKVRRGDTICVFMKNIPKHVDGVYIIGTVQKTRPKQKEFVWSIDRERSKKVVSSPIPRSTIRRFFDRCYGNSMQALPENLEKRWLSLFG